MIPFELETAVDGYRETHKIVIEKAAANSNLSDTLVRQAQRGVAADACRTSMARSRAYTVCTLDRARNRLCGFECCARRSGPQARACR